MAECKKLLNNILTFCFDDDLISMNFFYQENTDAYAKSNVLITFNVIMAAESIERRIKVESVIRTECMAYG